MVEPSRYSVSQKNSGLDQDILENKLAITDQESLEDHETLLIRDAYDYFFDKLKNGDLIFDVKLIFQIHRYFLSDLYDWAGKIRKVDISKNGVMFCHAAFIENNLKEFEKLLRQHLPKNGEDKSTISKKLAIVHNEFNAIHPFRDGNGRTLRLFIDLIAANIGYLPIDYRISGREAYLQSCAQGMALNHEPMAKIFYKGLKHK